MIQIEASSPCIVLSLNFIDGIIESPLERPGFEKIWNSESVCESYWRGHYAIKRHRGVEFYNWERVYLKRGLYS